MLRYLSVLLLLFFAGGLTAQSAPAKQQRAATRKVSLAQAQALRKDDPEAAIRMLNSLLRQKAEPGTMTDAFLLLGDIYLDIGQTDLALGRYDRAAEVLMPGDEGRRAILAYKQGRAQLKLKDYAAARYSFMRCLDITEEGSSQNVACREGLADLEAEQRNYQVSQQYYGQVKDFAPDSLTQLRINTKQADVYLQQNDLPNATNSLNMAIQQTPRNQDIPARESEELLATNAKLRRAVVRDAPNLDVAVVEALPSAPVDLVVSDEFSRFRALRDKGDMAKARVVLENTLDKISDKTSPDIATEVYAEGAGFYLDNSETTLAAGVYQQYAGASDQLLAARRAALDQQVAILKEQQNIDLGLKDLRAEAVEDAFRDRQLSLQQSLNYLLGALLLVAIISVIFILRNVQKRRRANQELLLRNLQARMNPHFIFNSLNSINNYIARQDERSANRYLGRFAKLMRKVLDQSGKDFVPLSEELEQLQLYLELEKERFGGKFDYEIETGADNLVSPEELEIPPMILQPFVENAIWHGLRYREDGGWLRVSVQQSADEVCVFIEDNGIGRDKSQALKTENQRKHRSAGMVTSAQRLTLVNNHYGKDYSLHIADAFPGEVNVGTRVKIRLS